MWWNTPDAARHLAANLSLLSPAGRAAVQSVPAEALRVDAQATAEGTLVQGHDEQWHPLCGMGDPRVSADRQAARLIGETPPPLIIVIGVGLGYVLDALEERAATTRVLAIEPCLASVRALLMRRDWSGWLRDGRLTLLVGPDYDGASQAWRLVGAETPPVVASPALDRVCPADVAAAKRVAAGIVSGAKANDAARKRFAGRYLLNTVTNLPFITSEGDAASLDGVFQGRPAVVVAAGPSLDHNLEALRPISDRVIVIAVDTAARVLLAAGIHPDIVVAVDPSDANARHLRHMPDCRGMWLVTEGSLGPDVLDQFAGRAFVFRVSDHHPWPWLADLGVRRGTLRAWGSVLTTAFDLAIRLGCGPIAFVGADLAYTDGLLYCRNTVYEPEWRHLTTTEARAAAFKDHIAATGQIEAVGIDGAPVLTAPRFQHFRDWLVSRSRETAERVVNATGRGILAGGRIEQHPLAALSLPPFPDRRQAVHDILRAAWLSGAEARAQAAARVAAALAPPPAVTLDTWFAFGGDTASRAEIEACAVAAGRAMTRVARERDRLAARRPAAAPALTRAEAEELSHGYFAVAARKAPSTQAHLLLDVLQRTYTPDPSGGLPGVLSAVSRVPVGLRALDVGCGVGRGMVPLVQAGVHVDGVDIDARLLAHAQANPTLRGSTFFLTPGDDCGDALDGAYDLVYSQLCFRGIPSRSARRRLLSAMARAAAPSGVVVVQLRYHRGTRASEVPAPHVPWSFDTTDTQVAAPMAEVWPTYDELPLMLDDFAEHVRDVRLQFIDFPPERGLPAQLMLSGSPAIGLAERVYALTDVAVERAA